MGMQLTDASVGGIYSGQKNCANVKFFKNAKKREMFIRLNWEQKYY